MTKTSELVHFIHSVHLYTMHTEQDGALAEKNTDSFDVPSTEIESGMKFKAKKFFEQEVEFKQVN